LIEIYFKNIILQVLAYVEKLQSNEKKTDVTFAARRIVLIWITKTKDNAIINKLLFRKECIVCIYVYNISGGVANIFYQSCAQIDNNQQVYEAHIQVSRCNIILKAGSHECQKLRPLHLVVVIPFLIQM
jgi:hypothetical protein